jgi:hypothetical protein
MPPLPQKKAPIDQYIRRKFGDREIVLDPMGFFPKHMRDMREFLAGLRAPKTYISMVPMSQTETLADYEKRLKDEQTIDKLRPREGETPEEGGIRVAMPPMDDLDFALPILNKLIELQNNFLTEDKQQEPLSQDEFDSVRWIDTKEFVFKGLDACGIYAREYESKSILEV